MFSFWSYVLLLLASLHSSRSKLIQVTVDDQIPDTLTGAHLVYNPNSQWLYNATQACNECSSLDPSQTKNGTWTSNIYRTNAGQSQTDPPPNASISFTGSSISVYCIIPSFQNISAKSHMIFFLDGRKASEYGPIPNDRDEFIYQALAYTSGTIAMDNHTLTIQNGLADGQEYSMILDYITFLTDLSEQPGSASSNSSKVKALTGVLITVCILFAVTLVYLLYRLYSTRKRLDSPSRVDMENVHTASPRMGQPSLRRWLTRYLSYNTSKRNFSFDRSLFVVDRSRPQGESAKDFAPLDITGGGQPQPQPVLTEEAPTETQSRSRWAFVMSWRDRAMREAQIPTLPPTSHAPTTVFSGSNVTLQTAHHKPSNGQQQQDAPETARPQTRRPFTIVNA